LEADRKKWKDVVGQAKAHSKLYKKEEEEEEGGGGEGGGGGGGGEGGGDAEGGGGGDVEGGGGGEEGGGVTGKLTYLVKGMSQQHFVYQTSHKAWTGINHRPCGDTPLTNCLSHSMDNIILINLLIS